MRVRKRSNHASARCSDAIIAMHAAKTAATPLDFAFFTRRINPIFSDPSAIAGGAQNRVCADCHGVAVVGQSAPNGSNFPMIGNASDKARLGFNFSSAANFVNVIRPEGSSLFLYPTNEIANLDNPFATGLPHPGGQAFAIDSQQARDILTQKREEEARLIGEHKLPLIPGGAALAAGSATGGRSLVNDPFCQSILEMGGTVNECEAAQRP